MTSKKIIYNGNLIPENKTNFENRAFLYGDSVFETIKAVNGNLIFFDEHINRLIKATEVLKYKMPDIFTKNKNILKNEIISLLNKNKIFNAARIKINVFRKQGGLYTPENNNAEYVITTAKLENKNYILNKNGLICDIFEKIKKPINIFSPYKINANSLIYVLAGIHKKEKNLDDCFMLNDKNQITESISSNIFIVKNKEIFTPPLSSGCINGIIRNKIKLIAKQNSIPVYERDIYEKDIIEADEIFLTNSINGIKWVVAYKNKRYFKRMSVVFNKELNALSQTDN